MKGTLNIYKRIILQFLLFLGCYFLSRLIFTCFNGHQFRSLNASEFLSIAFAGLRYDISAFFAVNSLYILMLFFPFGQYYAAFKEKIANFIFIFFNSIALAFEISDWAYLVRCGREGASQPPCIGFCAWPSSTRPSNPLRPKPIRAANS